MLPAYSFLLGLIALLGYVALASWQWWRRIRMRRFRCCFFAIVSGVVRGVLPGGDRGGGAGTGGDYVDCGFEFVYAKSLWGLCARERDDSGGGSLRWRRWFRWW